MQTRSTAPQRAPKTAFYISSLLASGVLGAGAPLALAPLQWLPALFCCCGGLFLLLDQNAGTGRALLLGWLFGFFSFVVGVGWIVTSFSVDPERFNGFAVPAIVGLSALLALFPAFACAGAKKLGGTGWRLLIAFGLCWNLAEWLRGHILTGFPWNLVGYAWGSYIQILQIASVVGIYGLGVITVLLAALPMLAVRQKGPLAKLVPVGGAVATAAMLWAFGTYRLERATTATVPNVRLRLVQVGVPPTVHWDRQKRARVLAREIALSQLPPTPGNTTPTDIIWPEAAVPYILDDAPQILHEVESAIPDRGLLITGAVRRSRSDHDRGLLNSIVAVDGSGEIVGAYDKIHLVPFGEYMPLRSLLPFKKLTAGSIDFVGGRGEALMTFGRLPPAVTQICYEAAFPGALTEAQSRADVQWILNVTNDAWFGTSWGPYQHFLAARVRAIELGLPLVRAANTGISAVVDAYGRVREALPLGVVGILDSGLPQAAAARTPYSRWGDTPFWIGSSLLLAVALVAGRRARHRREKAKHI